MKRRLLLTLVLGSLAGCTCAQLPEAFFLCEEDGSCAQPNHLCGADNVCRPRPPSVDAGCGDLTASPTNCGACGRVCASGACAAGRCVCLTDGECPSGTLCSPSGLCTPSSDPCVSIVCPPNQVCRPATGLCAPVPCADGCLPGELCDTGAGLCRGLSACRLPRACDGGVCEGDPRPDGTPCDDLDPCSAGDQCVAGTCTGTAYSCPGSTACADAVVCAGDGGCTGTPKTDGTPCDDGEACTVGDECTGGVCSGTTYSCSGASACLASVACDGDGGCVGTPGNEGGSCDDGVGCTAGDRCTSGTCTGTAYTCPAPLPCQQAVACAGDGGCVITDKLEGDSCDDGLACTSGDICTGGVCAGTPGTSYRDLDGDGRGDSNVTFTGCPAPAGYVSVGGDCNDNDPGVFQAVMNLVADLDGDGYATGTPDVQCVGAQVTVSGRTYYRNSAGVAAWLVASEALGTDCDDTTATLFQSVANLVADVDRDGRGSGAAATRCVGASSMTGGRTYYVAAGGASTWLLASDSLGTDCNDTNANIFVTVASLVTDADQDGFTVGTPASQCVGATSTAGGRTYYANASGAPTWLASSASLGTDCNDNNPAITGPTTWYLDGDGDGVGGSTTQVACTAPANHVAMGGDCNDANGNVYRNVAGLVTDADQDGYSVGSAGTQCVGATQTVGGRTYYRAASGAFSWLSGTPLGTDCDDNNASVLGPTTWYVDADGDGRGGTATLVQCSQPAGYTATPGDCNDNNANVFQLVNVYDDTDQDGWTDGAIALASRCVGATQTVNTRTYYRDIGGAYTWIATSLGTDCNDNNAAVFQTVSNVVADDDRDGYPPNNVQTTECAGATSTFGGRTYYAASAAANDYWMNRTDCINRSGSNCTAPFDCYDLNANARPGQTAYFGTHRGDGSFDYDCVGGATTLQTGTWCPGTTSTTTYSDAGCSSIVGTQVVCTSTAAMSLPAACGNYLAGGGTFYNPGTCTSTNLRSATQVLCR